MLGFTEVMQRDSVINQDAGASDENAPLFVDLDGSLIRTNSIHEAAIILARVRPWLLFLLPFWLMRGQAFLWSRLAGAISMDVSLLPYRSEVLEFLRREHAAGRRIILISGAHESIVGQVAGHIGLFSNWFGSTESRHLVAARKLEVIEESFGRIEFDYLGDSRRDIAIWSVCRRAIVVSDDPRFVERIGKAASEVTPIVPSTGSRTAAFLRSLRPHQWAKNLLLFAAVILSHQFQNLEKLGASAIAFIAFSLCGSAVYIINDLLDLEADRRHSTKRNRPFAAGDVSPLAGSVAAVVLLILAFLVAARLPGAFAAVLGVYFMLTVLYSFHFKSVALIDVLLLGALYTIRVRAGGAATGIVISQWALAFFMCLFFSIALAKRCSELRAQADPLNQGVQNRRGYRISDLQFLMSLGCSSALMSVLVIALYINSQDVIRYYSRPSALWLICPVFAYWLSRLWLLAARGELDEDPVLFTIRDRTSYLAGLIMLLIFLFAI